MAHDFIVLQYDIIEYRLSIKQIQPIVMQHYKSTMVALEKDMQNKIINKKVRFGIQNFTENGKISLFDNVSADSANSNIIAHLKRRTNVDIIYSAFNANKHNMRVSGDGGIELYQQAEYAAACQKILSNINEKHDKDVCDYMRINRLSCISCFVTDILQSNAEIIAVGYL
ncbi:hypothetical protein KA977_11285 [Candidatus Dependentiae bacterium]|nr:hypothetical protein [Candidatus Dependentiae bacterium]